MVAEKEDNIKIRVIFVCVCMYAHTHIYTHTQNCESCVKFLSLSYTFMILEIST